MNTNYLNICPFDNITKNETTYTGYIYPKNYRNWAECDPLTLLFEGIHQFCVRIARLSTTKELNSHSHKIPAKIKGLQLLSTPDFSPYQIEGNLKSTTIIDLVAFSVYSPTKSNLIAQGEVYIADLQF